MNGAASHLLQEGFRLLNPVRWGLLSAASVAVPAPVVLVTLLVHRAMRAGFGGDVG